MRRGFALIALLLAFGSAALANGFGGFGEDAPPARIPVPAEDFRAVLTDQKGVTVEVTQATFDGEVFVHGKLGEGVATVPFERIASVRVEPSQEEDHVVAFVTLTDGTSVSLSVAAEVPCYGRTAFGNYRVPFDKLRKIEFLQ